MYSEISNILNSKKDFTRSEMIPKRWTDVNEQVCQQRSTLLAANTRKDCPGYIVVATVASKEHGVTSHKPPATAKYWPPSSSFY